MDPSEDEAFPYPIETLRHTYLSPLGGRSADLTLGQVGVRREALERNTNLAPGEDRVTLAVLGAPGRRPLFLHAYFEVVGLDEARPEALELSLRGEIVLPEDAWSFARQPEFEVPPGTPLQLKAAAAKIFGGPPERTVAEALSEALRRRRGSS